MAKSKGGNIINIILALMSFFAILISFFTLNEMKKQRQLSLEPNLFIEEIKPLQVKIDPACDSCIFSYVDNINSDKKSVFDILNIINVGNGNAVNVKVDWDLQVDEYEKVIYGNGYTEEQFSTAIEDDFCKISYVTESGSGNTAGYVGGESHSHILSASTIDESYSFKIPYLIIQLAGIAAQSELIATNNGEHYNSSKLVFNQKLKLSYDGTDGRHYEKKYNMMIQLIHIILHTSQSDGTKFSQPRENQILYIQVSEV